MEFIIDSITSKDSTHKTAIRLIRAYTNNMRNDFESAVSSLIEVDSNRRYTRNPTRNANVSSKDFSAGRRTTGVDLRFYPKDKFFALPQEQQTELREWLTTKEGKKCKKEYFATKKKDGDDKFSGK